MDILLIYFPDLTEDQISKFKQLGELYIEWNDKINVISRKDMEHLFERHILHGLAINKLITFAPQTKILDVGTGGGIPGIPLAILNPEADFHLVDSIGKKIMVVNTIIESLGLTNVTAEHKRAEQVDDHFDFVVCRGVTRLANFIPWVENKISKNHFHDLKNGIICLKGGDLKEELSEVKRKTTVFDLDDFFEEDFFETKKIVHVQFY